MRICVAVILTGLFLFGGGDCEAGRYALIICGKSGLASVEADAGALVKELHGLLIRAHGFELGNIRVLSQSPEEVKGSFTDLEGVLGAADSLWLILLGHGTAGAKGYSLVLPGGRLRGTDIAAFMGKVSCGKLLFCLGAAGGGLLEELRTIPGLSGFSATASGGQNVTPRLTALMLREGGGAGDMFGLLSRSVAGVDKYFRDNNLAATETAVVLTGGELKPFAGGAALELSGFMSSGGDGRVRGGQSVSAERGRMPSTAENRALIKGAADLSQRLPGRDVYMAERRIEICCNDDFSVRTRYVNHVYAGSAATASRYAVLSLPKGHELVRAKVIYGDGTSVEPLPERNALGTYLRFPVTSGGVLLISEVESLLPRSGQFPGVDACVVLETEMPTAKLDLVFTASERLPVRCRLLNVPESPEFAAAGGHREWRMTINDVPAFNPPPGSLPSGRVRKVLLYSSVKGWEEIRDFYARLSRSSMEAGVRLREVVSGLTAGASTAEEKLRRLYAFLCDLRYDTTPVGVSALKPRPPERVVAEGYGDCKDKANALVVMAGLAGIRGEVALVNRGGYTDRDFPAWQFNHALAFFPGLPAYPEGLWCDATDGSTPFGVLPPGVRGCAALMTGGGDVLFRTVKMNVSGGNYVDEVLSFADFVDNEHKGELRIEAGGLADYRFRKALKHLDIKGRLAFFQEYINNIMDFTEVTGVTELSDLDDLGKGFRVTLELRCHARLNPARVGFARRVYAMFMPESRPYGLLLNDGQGLKHRQTLRIKGCGVELIPDMAETCGHGEFARGMTREGDGLKRTLLLDLKQGEFTSDEYRDFRKQIINWTY